MKTKTKKIKASIEVDDVYKSNDCSGGEWWAQIGQFPNHISASSFKSELEAKKKLAKKVVEHALQKAQDENNLKKALIFTDSPHSDIFIVQFKHGSWMYTIARKDTETASGGTMGNWKTFDQARDAARLHAKDFGAITRELTF